MAALKHYVSLCNIPLQLANKTKSGMSGDFKSFFNGTDFFAIETVEIKKILVRT